MKEDRICRQTDAAYLKSRNVHVQKMLRVTRILAKFALLNVRGEKKSNLVREIKGSLKKYFQYI